MKFVSHIPLKKLWNEEGLLHVQRDFYLKKHEVEEVLKKYSVEFVVANVGSSLNWVSVDRCYEFWKEEAQNHCAINPDEFYLEDYPEEYVYVASEWSGEIQTPIILLEMHH